MGAGAFASDLPTLNGQILVDSNLATGNKSGYHFEVVEQAGVNASAVYGVYAYPLITSGVSMTAIAADVPLGPGPTLYTRTGDMFAWLCVLAFLLLGFLAIRAGGSGRERPREV